MNGLLTIPQVAARAGITHARVRAMVVKGALGADRSGKPWLIPEGEYRRVFEPAPPSPAPAAAPELTAAQIDALAAAVVRQLLGALAQLTREVR